MVLAKAPGLFDFGQIDLEFLAAQMLRGVLFLPGFGMDGVPELHVDYGNTDSECAPDHAAIDSQRRAGGGRGQRAGNVGDQ